VIDAIKRISSATEPGDISKCIREEASKVLNSQTATLFVHNRESDELVTLVSKGAGRGMKKVAQTAGAGFVGQVFTMSQVINVEDVYKDPRFNPNSDQVQTLVSAERSQLFLVDEVARKMVLITERGESRTAMSVGLQGAC